MLDHHFNISTADSRSEPDRSVCRRSGDVRDACGHGSNARYFPKRDTLAGLAKGLSEAHCAFCSLQGMIVSDAVLVMVVQPKEWNVFDQLWLQVCSNIDVVGLVICDLSVPHVEHSAHV